MNVIPIDKATAELFVKKKHYSRRASVFLAAFGLEIGGKIEGVVVYGMPSPAVNRHAFRDRDFRLYELSRLVVQTKERNAASILVGRSLQMLPAPCAVVSYADTEQGHSGIIYQATNWTYTGATVSHDHLYMIDGERLHPMALRDRGITDPKRWAKDHGIETVRPSPKHRYFFSIGDRRQRRSIMNRLVYPVVHEYPKSEQTRYDDGPTISVQAYSRQQSLF